MPARAGVGIDETGSRSTGAIWAVRQGQQNRRGRGRNNRKSHNPLGRSFESNGPDVKIRGTPAHIAEKYLTLARDAQSGGDPVLAENYLQHAEHYTRIIMAYREQMGHPGAEGYNGNGQRMRGPSEHGEGGDDFGEDEGEDILDEGFQPPHMAQQPQPQSQPQPQPPVQMRHPEARPPFEGGRQDRPFRRDQGRFRDRGDRDRGDRDRHAEGRPHPADRQPEQGEGGSESRRRDRFQQPHEQPDFLRRPVRRARSESEETPSTKEEPSRD